MTRIGALLFALWLGLPVVASEAEEKGIPHSCDWAVPLLLHVAGTTTLSFCIRTDGFLERIAVAVSSGISELDKIGLYCVSKWHYLPAQHNGNPVAVPWGASVEFKESAWGRERTLVTEIPQHIDETRVQQCTAAVS
jgi:hypothetical protein